MDRRKFLTTGAAAGAGYALSISQQAEALEERMMQELEEGVIVRSRFCQFGTPQADIVAARAEASERNQGRHFQMGHDPRLPRIPDKPTLIDFFKYRFAPASHLLQSGALALKAGLDEETVLACLLHDIGVFALSRSEHGYWGAALIEPYVSERVSWAVRYHQALRFYPDLAAGYEYPEAYIRYFGTDYKPEPHIQRDAEYAQNHRWYMTARQICINDIYSFDPDANPSLELFVDIIGRHFKQPEEGLGFDNTPVSHQWRTLIWPTNFL
ncbi:MAG: HD domain-containing protein [Dehalococcoidia bacterium]|nr:HD domain-containing protein [Dehalococcoidia bacterium]